MLTNQVPWLDWRLATCAMVADYIRFQADCVRERDPGIPVSDQSYEVDPAQNGQDPWAINQGMDVAGTSMFTSTVPGDYMTGNWLLQTTSPLGWRGQAVLDLGAARRGAD